MKPHATMTMRNATTAKKAPGRIAGREQVEEVHPVDAGYEVRDHDDDGDRGQSLHDLAEPVERREDVHVERGAQQVAIGVELGQHVHGVVLHVGEVGPEALRDGLLAPKHLGEHVAGGRQESGHPEQLLPEPEQVGGGTFGAGEDGLFDALDLLSHPVLHHEVPLHQALEQRDTPGTAIPCAGSRS